MALEVKIIPPVDVNTEELEASLDCMDDLVNAEIRKARKRAFFFSKWSKDSSNSPPTYKLSLEYTGEGRIKNFVMKRMMKMMFRKVDKRIKVK